MLGDCSHQVIITLLILLIILVIFVLQKLSTKSAIQSFTRGLVQPSEIGVGDKNNNKKKNDYSNIKNY